MNNNNNTTPKKENKIKYVPELISPAGDWISLRAAIASGANSIYFGIKGLNMRVNTKNFSTSDLKKISQLCKKNNVKSYLTLNTIIYDKEIKKVETIIKKAKQNNINAIVCWDMSVIQLCKKHKMPFHISTQASISNYESLKYYAKLGAKYVVLARELTLEQIISIIKKRNKDKLKIKIETFIHGAMCVSVSGRCFISQFQFGKSANRGDCIQPCRRGYTVHDPEEKNKLKINKNYVMSPKDLCTIDIIKHLQKAKIDAFKIEGRNRSPEYVKITTEVYREAIDNNTIDTKKLKKQLETVYNRGFSNGFFMGKPIDEWTDAYGSKATKKKIFTGVVKNYFNKPEVAEIHLQSKPIKTGDHIMIQGPTTGIIEFTVKNFMVNNKPSTRSKKGDTITIKTKKVRKNDRAYLIN